jgi:hypothetical protein
MLKHAHPFCSFIPIAWCIASDTVIKDQEELLVDTLRHNFPYAFLYLYIPSFFTWLSLSTAIKLVGYMPLFKNPDYTHFG